MRAGKLISAALIVGLMFGCSGVRKSLHKTKAENLHNRLNVTSTHKDLVSLPAPSRQIEVGVYKFQDQTGQFKPKENATSFSTAVTQGGTSMLVKALEDSGWFVPVEREGLANLLNERKIISSTRQQTAAQSGTQAQNLPPLLFSSILMEGGVISYDTNVVTGGLGAEHFGLGGSAEVRRDQVSVYLRAVSVSNGRVLASVATTKTILSQRVNFSLIRFVSFQRLLEAEVGFSTNEPPQMAVLEAIERAVIDLIVHGLRNNLWQLKDQEHMNSEVIQRYVKAQEGIPLDEDGKPIIESSEDQSQNQTQKGIGPKI